MKKIKAPARRLEVDGIFRRVQEIQAEVKELLDRKERRTRVSEIARLEEIIKEAESHLGHLLQIRDEILKIH